jgi:hypothetical protein
MAAAIVLSLAKYGYDLYQSEAQKEKAKEIDKNTKRPKREVSPATNELVRRTRFNAGKYGMPGQAQVEAKLDRATAGSTRAIKDMGISPYAMMGAFGRTEQARNQSLENIGIKAAEYKDRQEGLYQSALRQLGTEQNQNWQWNDQQKYLDAAAASSALKNASLRNQEQAIYGGLQAVGQYAQMNRGADPYGTPTPANPTTANPFAPPMAATGNAPSGPFDANQYAQQLYGGPYTAPKTPYTGSLSDSPSPMGPIRFDPYSQDVAAYKDQFASIYGYTPTDEEVMQYYRLMNVMPSR